MKNACLSLMMLLLIIACKPKVSTDAATSKTDSVAYPYTIKHPDQWLIDTSHANIVTALKSIKSFEDNDTAAMKKCFADSLTANFDGVMFKGTARQFVAMIKRWRDDEKTVHVTMHDWQAVTSKATKEHWVTVWYKEVSPAPQGKVDSIELVNDFQFKDGLIVTLNEFVRHPKP